MRIWIWRRQSAELIGLALVNQAALAFALQLLDQQATLFELLVAVHEKRPE